MDLIAVVVGWGVNPLSGDVGTGVCGEGFMRDITAVFTELDACYASRPLARDAPQKAPVLCTHGYLRRYCL